MDNFSISPIEPPSGDHAQPGIPPRHKKKMASPAKDSSIDDTQLQANSPETEEEAEAKLQKMLDEKLPVIKQKDPQCDWHLGAMFAGDYPDPFSLPAVHVVKKSMMNDIIATAADLVKIMRDIEKAEGAD